MGAWLRGVERRGLTSPSSNLVKARMRRYLPDPPRLPYQPSSSRRGRGGDQGEEDGA